MLILIKCLWYPVIFLYNSYHWIFLRKAKSSENITPLQWTPFWKLLCKSKSCRLQRESVTKVRQAQIPPLRHFFWLRFSALKENLIRDRKTRGKLLSRCAFLCRWCAAKENQRRLNYKNDQQSQTGWEIVRSDGSCSLQNNGTAWHIGKDEATSDGWQRLFEVCWDWVIHAIMFEAFRGGDDHLSFFRTSPNLQGKPCCSLSWGNGQAIALASLLPDSL